MRGWTLVAIVAVQTFAMRWIGSSSSGWLAKSPTGLRVIGYVAPAVLGGLVALATFTSGDAVVVDARALGVAVAAVAIAARAPILVVVGLAVTVTALLRAVT
ncbi:MAG: AzlD domain-containing protein [Acidimicrobiia bacterium]|nr:AzlD domain-containing protein [Acidimicrobiia bacterium]